SRRRAPAVACLAAGRRAPPPPARAVRLHGARPAAAPNGREDGALALAAATLRPRRRALGARAGDPRGARRGGARDPASRLPPRPDADRRRDGALLRDHPPLPRARRRGG